MPPVVYTDDNGGINAALFIRRLYEKKITTAVL